jgi:hypothetical protein
MSERIPRTTCAHEVFDAQVGIHRLTRSDEDPTVIAFMAEVAVECEQCGERFRWIGAPAGHLPNQPTRTVDGFTLNVPLRPASADEDFGLGIPGFRVRYTETT